MSGGVLYEALSLRIAYTDLVHHCCVVRGRGIDDVPIEEVLRGLDELGPARCAAFLYVTRVADDLGEGAHTYARIRAMLEDGRRPQPWEALVGAFPEAPRPPRDPTNPEGGGAGVLRRLKRWLEDKLVADEETSAWMDRADREQRIREGKLP